MEVMNDSILFAEWLAENQYRPYNLTNEGVEWVNEEDRGLTDQLYEKFKEELVKNYEK